MKKKVKSLSGSSVKKKMLLSTLIPIGFLMLTAAIVVPLVLILRNDKTGQPNDKTDLTNEYAITAKQNGSPTKDYILDYVKKQDSKTVIMGIDDFDWTGPSEMQAKLTVKGTHKDYKGIITVDYQQKENLTDMYSWSTKQNGIPLKNDILAYVNEQNSKTTSMGIDDFIWTGPSETQAKLKVSDSNTNYKGEITVNYEQVDKEAVTGTYPDSTPYNFKPLNRDVFDFAKTQNTKLNNSGLTEGNFNWDRTDPQKVIMTVKDENWNYKGSITIEYPNITLNLMPWKDAKQYFLCDTTMRGFIDTDSAYAFQTAMNNGYYDGVEFGPEIISIAQNAFYLPSKPTFPSSLSFAISMPSVTSVGNYAFRGCAGITQIDSSISAVSIGNGAFMGCTNLDLSNSEGFIISSLGRDAFSGCSSLTEIDLSNVSIIGIDTFLNCNNLITVVCPASGFSVINAYAFQSCVKLESQIVIAAPSTTSPPSIGSWAFYDCAKDTTKGLQIKFLGTAADYDTNASVDQYALKDLASKGELWGNDDQTDSANWVAFIISHGDSSFTFDGTNWKYSKN